MEGTLEDDGEETAQAKAQAPGRRRRQLRPDVAAVPSKFTRDLYERPGGSLFWRKDVCGTCGSRWPPAHPSQDIEYHVCWRGEKTFLSIRPPRGPAT
jgi:hypothetical protein